MGGNGDYEAHNCTNALPTGLNCIPPGKGGGCVTKGPFKKYVKRCLLSPLSFNSLPLSLASLSTRLRCYQTNTYPVSMSVNLGPVSPTLEIPQLEASFPGSAYNPRCLRRDISPWVSSRWSTDSETTKLITQNTNSEYLLPQKASRSSLLPLIHTPK